MRTYASDVRVRRASYPRMLSTGVCTTTPLSTPSCGRSCVHSCAQEFMRETPCEGCAPGTRTCPTPNEAGNGTGATRSHEPRREAARSENGGPSRRGQPHRLRVSAQGNVRTGRETIRSRGGRLAGRNAAAAVTPAGLAGPGLARVRPDGRWRGPSNSYFEGPRCVAGRECLAGQGFSTRVSNLET